MDWQVRWYRVAVVGSADEAAEAAGRCICAGGGYAEEPHSGPVMVIPA